METDLELLETYLDGEVTAAEADALQHRLQAEPELSAVLDDLRAQRTIRQSVWQSLEPDQKSADQFAWRIRGAMQTQQQTQQQTPASRTWNTWQFARFGSAAAACIVLGFFVGWVGRGHHANVSTIVVPSEQHDAGQSVAQVQMVPVTNEYGQVVAWQPFKDPNDAKAFVEDLHRANTAAPATGAPPDDKVKLISSEEKF